MHIEVSYTNPTPLYRQIADQIKEKVFSGELAPGTPLPSIRQLAHQVKASVITVKRAYAELEAEGIIVTRAAMGSFVADIDARRLKRIKLAELRERLSELVADARAAGVTEEELMELIREVLK